MRALRKTITALGVAGALAAAFVTASAQPAGVGTPQAGSNVVQPQTNNAGSNIPAPEVKGPVDKGQAAGSAARATGADPAATGSAASVGSAAAAAGSGAGSAAATGSGAGSAATGSGAGSGAAAEAPKEPMAKVVDCATLPVDAPTVTTENGEFNPPYLTVPTDSAIRFKLTTDDVQPYPNSKYPELVARANATTCIKLGGTNQYKLHSGSHPIELIVNAKPWYDILADRPVEPGGTFFMPQAVNLEAGDSDFMFYSVLGLSIFFFFAIAGAVIYLTIKYRHRPGHKAEPSVAHNDTLEITWTVIPTIMCVFLFYYGWHAYVKVVTPPTKAVEIQVLAKQWAWNFTHANGVTDSDLHIPINTPVRFVMTSNDVLHSFYIPVMRIKQDIVPRRYTYAWLDAQRPGTYRLNCAEYCGTHHSEMGRTGPILPQWPDGRRAVVVVHEPGGYERYLSDKQADQMKMDPIDLGKQLYEKKGCITCHTVDGTARIGPTWKSPDWGKMIPLADGSSVKMDENYLRESINIPSAKIHQGYANQMPAFEGQLKDTELAGLIAYIKSLKQ